MSDGDRPKRSVEEEDAIMSRDGEIGLAADEFTMAGTGEHQRGLINGPSLSIDTNVNRGQIPPRSPLSPGNINGSSYRSPPAISPATPRTRDRGFSLRRTLLTRTVPAHGPPIELEDLPAADIQSTASSHEYGRSSKLPATSISVAPAADDWDGRPRKSATQPIALPSYLETIRRKSRLKRLGIAIADAKERLRKTILRDYDLPPSKDGRHIPVFSDAEKPLLDERTGKAYIGNTIRSSRYTLYNFLPRQLFAQFSKLANFYFLCVSILQMIPGLSTTGTYTTIVPLLFFVTISMAKEGYDDLRRYRLDKTDNRKSTYVLRPYKAIEVALGDTDNVTVVTPNGPKQWTKVQWQDVKVGDIVKLTRDDAAPADLVLLQTESSENVAYVETMALDGETNLKTKHPPSLISSACRTTEDLVHCKAEIVVEDPNLDLYQFDGKITLGDESLPLTNTEVIYRGSILRNTINIKGLVINSGEECKIRMNATKNPRIKAPSLQSVVNKVVIIIVIFVIVLAIFNTVAYQIWNETTEEKAWYLANAHVAFFPILTSFIILFNTMIPLSLYVSLEIVKLCQMLLMSDLQMYDETTNTPMEARTSTINEELGQVNYIFSDKTGTLTNNIMKFRKMSVAGTAWLHDIDLRDAAEGTELEHAISPKRKPSKGKTPLRRTSMHKSGIPRQDQLASPLQSHFSIGRASSVHSNWRSSAKPRTAPTILNTKDLLQYIQRRPHTNFARRTEMFLLSMALCHTCYPEISVDGAITYQAASPDEQALVQAAQELGHIVIDRQNNVITIKTWPAGPDMAPTERQFQVLDVIEFSSARKRMSVVVRMPNQKICVFCKGADTTVIQLLRQSKLAMSKAVEVERRNDERHSLEAQEAIRRTSESRTGKESSARISFNLPRTSLGGVPRLSTGGTRLQPIRDEVDRWLSDRERDVEISSADAESLYYSPRPSTQTGHGRASSTFSPTGQASPQLQLDDDLVDESLVLDDAAVYERSFQHINDFASEGLRTLLYGYRYLGLEEYQCWKKLYLDASTSLVDRQGMMEKIGAQIECDFDLAGVTAIEDKLQDGVAETIDRLRRAKIKLWMLTGDKRETAINIGHSCRLIKDYSSITILDHETGNVSQKIAAAMLDIREGMVAHSVVVIDGQTLAQVTANEALRKLFVSLAILVDSVVCCRASPSQKASLVHSIRNKVKHAVTLAIGDGANDIAMIQEAHVGIGITGKEGLQAARTSDYSIAQFRFLARLLLVHGRWNYVRTCKYTLGTFWKEMMFYLTQALFQRYAGYTGTSLYESWSLSMFNTLFTSLPVIFMGIFEQDLTANTLMAVPELYSTLGPKNAGFNIGLYLWWVFLASSQAVIIFFSMLGLYGQPLTDSDHGLYAMGALSFTACVIVIATKMQFWELHNKTYTCAVALFLSIGGWFLWNILLSVTYQKNTVYNVRDGFLHRFGRSAPWWLTLLIIVFACWTFEIGLKVFGAAWLPSDADCFRELEKDPVIRARLDRAANDIPATPSDLPPSADDGLLLRRMRSPEEERQREGEVQDILDRRDGNSRRKASGVDDEDITHGAAAPLRRRRTSDSESGSRNPKVSFAVDHREIYSTAGATDASDQDLDEDDDKPERFQPPRKRSTDISELLRRGFGSVRRSLDSTLSP